jgi:hypothetical protein
MDFPPLLLPQHHHQHQVPPFSMNDDRKRFIPSNAELLPPFGSSSASSPFLSSLFPMGAPPMGSLLPHLPASIANNYPLSSSSSSSSLSRRNGGMHSTTSNSDSSKSSMFPSASLPSFDFTRSPLLPPGHPLANSQLESDRYRFILDQQARDRDLQYAMIAAASGNGPPQPLFGDPNASTLFKHY